VTVIMDFIHVLEYDWEAPTVFSKTGDEAAEKWVSEVMSVQLRRKA